MTQLIKIESPYEYPHGATYRHKDDDPLHPALVLDCSFDILKMRYEFTLSDGRHTVTTAEAEPLPEEEIYERIFLPLRAHLDAYKASCEGAGD